MTTTSTIKGIGETAAGDGSSLKVAIVHARWNSTIVDALVAGAVAALRARAVPAENITVLSVPGSYELPYAISRLDNSFDAVIAVGVLIKGQTMHFEYISDVVTKQLMALQFTLAKPIIFGLLTLLTEEQGLVRAGISPAGSGEQSYATHNHGEDWGHAAVEMALKSSQWPTGNYSA